MSGKKTFKLYGIFGHPLKHTLSPPMQEAAFRDKGIKAFYVALGLEKTKFCTSMQKISKLPLHGFNITVPYKQMVLRYLDRVSAEAKAVGAVNTVYKKGKFWCGTNTDAYGFVRSLKKDAKFRAYNKDCLILGAGGASRAVVYGLAKERARSVTIANRNLTKAKKLAREFRKAFPRVRIEAMALKQACKKPVVGASDLVVNATSIGLKKTDKKLLSASMVPKVSRKKKILFYDLIYSPAETPFLKLARTRGHQTLNGVGMLVFQGARAFECWTGKKAPEELMRTELVRALEQ